MRAKPFAAYAAGYSNLWSKCELAPETSAATIKTASALIEPVALDYYRAAAASSSVPIALIAALNYRESGGLFTRYLGNGDPLSRATTHVPAGRGPFANWQDGARDALANTERPSDGRWTVEFALYFAEEFNGRGYMAHDENSPYVWSQTNLEQRGMFTADHGYDATAWDQRPGVAAIFRAFEKIAPQFLLPSLSQRQEPQVATTTTPTTHDPFPLIIEALSLAKMFAPMLAPVIGPAPEAILQIALPALEEAIQFIEKARTTGVASNDVGDFIQKLAADIHAIGATLKPKQA